MHTQSRSRPTVAVLCVAPLLLGGCSQSAKDVGGAIGTVLGVAVGVALGGNSDMGPLGGALVGGTVGFIAGSFAGQVADDLEEKKQAATQAALGGGAIVRWASQTNPKVSGYTEIVQTVTVPAAVPGSKRSTRWVFAKQRRHYQPKTATAERMLIPPSLVRRSWHPTT